MLESIYNKSPFSILKGYMDTDGLFLEGQSGGSGQDLTVGRRKHMDISLFAPFVFFMVSYLVQVLPVQETFCYKKILRFWRLRPPLITEQWVP